MAMVTIFPLTSKSNTKGKDLLAKRPWWVEALGYQVLGAVISVFRVGSRPQRWSVPWDAFTVEYRAIGF